MRNHNILLFLWLPLVLAAPFCAFGQTAVESITPCAADPTYKYFEEIQRTQYIQHPNKAGYLKFDPALYSNLVTQLNKRPNILPGKPTIDVGDEVRINEFIKKLKAPTCFESPEIYWLIETHVQTIEAARKRLKLSLKAPPKFASLPTAEINAYTYPATGTHDSIIAFNTQLFMFDYQLAKAVIPSLGITLDPTGKYLVIRNDPNFTRAYLAAHPEVKGNFASSVLEFINYAPGHEHSVDQAYDAFIIALPLGMELFAVGHEYSHVIHGDRSVVSTLRLGMGDEGKSVDEVKQPQGQTVPVLARSWKQELSADELGAKLLIKSVQDDKSNTLYSRVRLHGP